MNVIHRRGEKTVLRTVGAFEIPGQSLFSDDKAEAAKATLARNQSIYGQATGAVGHGSAVIDGLSDRAQKQLKAVPFSAPVSSGRKSRGPALKQGGSSVCAVAFQDKV